MDKKCEKCGKLMINVHKNKRFCTKCQKDKFRIYLRGRKPTEKQREKSRKKSKEYQRRLREELKKINPPTEEQMIQLTEKIMRGLNNDRKE